MKIKMPKRNFFAKTVVLINLFGLLTSVIGQNTQTNFPVKRQETPETWRSDGLRALKRARNLNFRRRKAKNIILFIGDGMSISTLTAARILEGQLRRESGEENYLSFERFPFVALVKTYSVNQQTPDSAPTATAMMTGIKTNEGVISVNQNVLRGDFRASRLNGVKTLLEMAEEKGKSTGVVTTARLTHATPAACYAHTPDRKWESDADIFHSSKEAYNDGFPDIARQLIDFPYGNGLEVAMGGGRFNFMPKGVNDPEFPENPMMTGRRLDKRNLTEEWKAKGKNFAYVWNKKQFDAINARKIDHLLGLFQPSHMLYEHDRAKDKAGEPSLSEMTSKAIDILSKNGNGFFLMVEAGRIDHGHHFSNAYRALTDTIELSKAVKTAKSKVKLKDTLIIVTADHSHTLTIGGYPARGNNILGLVRQVGRNGKPKIKPETDINKKPYTTLNYAIGGGYKSKRLNLTDDDVTKPDYKQESAVPKTIEPHGGDDVAIFADGVNAWMFHGLMEQNWIFYIMQDAMRIKR